jgi:hypothetical protein
MTIPLNVNDTVPSAPAITINQTILQLDGNTAIFKDEYLDIGDSTGGLGIIFTLVAFPFQPESIILVRNSLVQRQNTDFFVDGNIVTLVSALGATDTLKISYFSVTGVSSYSARGTIIAYGGTVIPSGFISCDGVTAYSQTTYAALYAWLGLNLPSLILSTVGTISFTLKSTFVTLYVGGVLQTVQSIIKT